MTPTPPLTPPTPPADTRVKVPHLVMALLFLGTAAAWALVAGGVLDAGALPFLGPALLVAAGAAGLVAVALGSRRRESRAGDQRPVTMDAPAVHDRDDLDLHDDLHDDLEHTAPLTRPEDHR